MDCLLHEMGFILPDGKIDLVELHESFNEDKEIHFTFLHMIRKCLYPKGEGCERAYNLNVCFKNADPKVRGRRLMRRIKLSHVMLIRICFWSIFAALFPSLKWIMHFSMDSEMKQLIFSLNGRRQPTTGNGNSKDSSIHRRTFNEFMKYTKQNNNKNETKFKSHATVTSLLNYQLFNLCSKLNCSDCFFVFIKLVSPK